MDVSQILEHGIRYEIGVRGDVGHEFEVEAAEMEVVDPEEDAFCFLSDLLVH